MKQLFLILVLIFPAAFAPLSAQIQKEELNCYLLTIGPGKDLYLWFGHTGIIIEEENHSQFYDFGNFSFKSDHFYRNFAMGRLVYLKVGVSARAYQNYIVTEDRNVTLLKLNIPSEKILEMKEELERNILPGNNTYLYHHYLDNCSTRPRDIIDKALDGQLKDATDRDAGTSFRGSFRRYTSHSFFPDWLLSLLQGRTIDSPISVWETMFLPDELMKQLSLLQVKSGDSLEPAVLSTRVLAESSRNRTIPETAPSLAVPALLYGLAAGVLLMMLQSLSLGERRKSVFVFLFVFIMTIFSLFGLTVWFISFFTDHLVARENINVLMFHPLYLVAGFILTRNSAEKLLRFWQIQGGLWVLMVLFNAVYFHQGNLQTSLFFLSFLSCQLLIVKKPFHFGQKPS
ncbi:DUF4105 domain-containing protein [Oceanispirochaeta crateris]|uniref:lipoprotein N-acyltransferase Lnb domain-containing protein n=1 Tax=Oceanispirochaeta crateris TaxID=2518645 RepID=UPI00143D64A1|nr:DUF4105 domain-containing protein [Oceanispirochaeta crateris]